MTGAKTLLSLSAALAFVALAPAPVGFFGAESAFAAQTAAGTTSATVPDDTYGAGGTKESLSNAKHEVVAEIWRDKNGYIREQFATSDDGVQYWGFLQGEGFSTSEWGGTIEIRPMPRPIDRWEMTIYGPGYVTLKEFGLLSKDDLEKEFDHWHRQMRVWVNGFINPARPGG